jgi:hypothetical protein
MEVIITMSTKKRISVASAKAKGRDLQNWVGKQISDLICLPFGADCEVAGREMGQNGVDIRLVGDALHRFPYSVECKNCEQWDIHQWTLQAKSNLIPNTNWILFIKKNRVKPIVVLEQVLFENLVSQIPIDICWDHESICKEKWSVLAWVKKARASKLKHNKWCFNVKRKETEPISILDAEVFFEILSLIYNKESI